MPSRWTFTIKPIAELLKEEITEGVWVDPFAGENSPAKYRNDINPQSKAEFHLDALEFLQGSPSNSAEGVLLDPPYSPRQVQECYKSLGRKAAARMFTSGYLSDCKKEIVRIVKPGGKVLCFGWNSNGIGISNGFRLVRQLNVAHGGWHNDTIVTVEIRQNQNIL